MLVLYAWNLAESFNYEFFDCYKNFSPFEVHLISQKNFLPNLLKTETALLKLTKTNSNLIFFLTNLHANCTATSTRYVYHAHKVSGQFINIWISKSMLESSQLRFLLFWTDLIIDNPFFFMSNLEVNLVENIHKMLYPFSPLIILIILWILSSMAYPTQPQTWFCSISDFDQYGF
jgi:hypothetical protein